MYPITIDEFKLFFLRESGAEWQKYPNWKKTVWDTGDYCLLDNIFYRSLVDLNHAKPTDLPVVPEPESWEQCSVIWEPDTEYKKDTIVYAKSTWWLAVEDVPAQFPENRIWSNYWKVLCVEKRFPDAREWKEPISYAKDDKVVRVVNFKPTVMMSQADDNYTDPAVNPPIPDQDPEVLWWVESEEDNEDMDDWILDWDIERAMGEAIFKFNPRLFSEERGKMIFLYLTMFFLVYDRQMANAGMNGNNAAGPVIHRTVGKMSVSYKESVLFEKYPSYEFLSTNDYGRKAFNLMMPYLRGNVQVLKGMASGE